MWASPRPTNGRVVAITDQTEVARLGTSLDLYTDETGHASYRDAQRFYEEGRFRPSQIETPNLGFTKQVLWGRVEIDDQRRDRSPLVLEVGHSQLDLFELWTESDAQSEPIAQLGDALLFEKRTYQHRLPNMDLASPKGKSVYYFRASGDSSLSVPLALYTPRAYVDHVASDQGAQALYVGIMLALFVYNFFLYFGIRERSYLLYSTFIALYLFYQSTIAGLSFQYLWPQTPLISQRLVASTVVFAAAYAQLFALTFLDVKRAMPRLARSIRWLSGLYLAYLPYAAFGPGPGSYRITAGMGLFFSAVVLAIGVLSLRHGGRPARIFLLAWGLFLVGNILAALWLNGLIPRNQFTENAQQIGSALEGLLIAIALADRLRALTVAAETTQLERVRERERTARELEELNVELRRQVAERSREIAHLLQEISQPTPGEVSPDTIFEDRYRVIRTLGKGASGSVHEVERLTDKAHFALKVLLDVNSPETAARFAREAEIAARLRHPNLVSVVDFGVSQKRIMFLVMELIDGPTVAAEWKRYGNLSWALPLLLQVAKGLRALHGAGIVHRDLKPSNILLGQDAQGHPIAKIADFGLSRAHKSGFTPPPPPDPGASTQAVGTALTLESPSMAPDTLTQAGVLLGTPQYMPPELATGTPHVNPSVDIFAFGVMAVEMLAARSPFATPPVYAHLAGRGFVPAAPVHVLCPDLPEGIAKLLDRCLDEHPEARPMATELTEVISSSIYESGRIAL